MNSPGKVKDDIFNKMLMEEGLVMDNIEMVIDKLFLRRSVVLLNNAVDLRTPGITNHIFGSQYQHSKAWPRHRCWKISTYTQ